MVLNRELIASRFQDIRQSLERPERMKALSREAFLPTCELADPIMRKMKRCPQL